MSFKQIARQREIIYRSNMRVMIGIMKRFFALQFEDLISKLLSQRAPLTVNIDDLFNDWNKWDAILSGRVSPQVMQAVRAGFEQMKSSVKIGGTFNPNDVYIQNAIFDSMKKVTSINEKGLRRS